MPSVRWWIVLLCTYLVPPEVVGPAVSLVSTVPTWIAARWTGDVSAAWDITYAGSFYRTNSTASLLWLFSTFNHDVLLALFVFAVLVCGLSVVYVLAKSVQCSVSLLTCMVARARRACLGGEDTTAAFGSDDSVQLSTDLQVMSTPQPTVITPEGSQTPTIASPLPLIAPPTPAPAATPVPALGWQGDTAGRVVRHSRRLAGRFRSNSTPRVG